MALASILVVDPDGKARAQMAAELRGLGYDVAESENAGSALAALRRAQPDLMVCDCALPDLDGVELLTDVRRSEDLKSMRVVLLSGHDDGAAVVSALESGADDFIGKPLRMSEFLARIGACLRRPANPYTSSVVAAGGIAVDNVGHRVSVDDEFVSLAPREYRLLLFLLTNQDRVFSRDQLLVHVWDRDAAVGPRTVDVHIRRLRSILEPYEKEGFVQTVRGSGYRFSLSV